MKILFVTWGDSIHTARWIGQLSDTGWNLHLFPVDNGPYHPDLRALTIHSFYHQPKTDKRQNVRYAGIVKMPFKRGTARFRQHVVGALMPRYADDAKRLAYTIHKIKPDLIHSMELQRGGYLTAAAREIYREEHKGEFPAWAVSNWGSDIYLFGRMKNHLAPLRAVLEHCDFFTADCQRDIGLARDFGFKGHVLPVFPAGGGFDLDAMLKLRQPGKTSGRRLIVLKGYQNWAGRAQVAIRALEVCQDALKNYEIAIFSSTHEVEIAAELLSHSTGIKVHFVRGTHDDILRLHGRARVSIGLSISDGIPSSTLEAMIMGSFPIQSDTSCANEWLQHGSSGFIVPPEDPVEVAAAIRRALSDDDLVDRAAEINLEVARQRLAYPIVQRGVIGMYEEINKAKRLFNDRY